MFWREGWRDKKENIFWSSDKDYFTSAQGREVNLVIDRLKNASTLIQKIPSYQLSHTLIPIPWYWWWQWKLSIWIWDFRRWFLVPTVSLRNYLGGRLTYTSFYQQRNEKHLKRKWNCKNECQMSMSNPKKHFIYNYSFYV